MNSGDRRINVRCKRGRELAAVQLQEPILGRKDRRDRRARRRIGDQGFDRLAGVGSKGRDVSEAADFRIVAGLGDDRASIGMADEDDRVLRGCNRALGDDHVIGERDGRVLDDDDFVSVLGQDVVDALPAGSVDESAVDQDDANGLVSHGNAPSLSGVGAEPLNVEPATLPALYGLRLDSRHFAILVGRRNVEIQ